ncbi:TIGR00730 family Rossman fold protein [Segetibacter sp. 3557_3]|uniref:LOG family protein n=1 Tax=Segetibacter sp. 3557_3 TaxID=2547429 RepID=UPI00105866E3|nr:TIGR00730 family Rossman fold protein [Segetibacter sp. 3557_3]TDH27865.1 TIGR00730 family Rossman fold protein [Segetibacter sp. 3557_3]
MQYKAIAVFCGSKNGTNPIFSEHAAQLGKLMGENGIRLIYGGGRKGLMGALANGVMSNGGKVMGVIPELLIGWEHQHEGITDLQVVEDMHTRKKIMYDMCDAAIILPGGYGTMDEMFEMLTWNTLNIHNKTLIILNSGGFYNHLIAHIEQMSEVDFLYEEWNKRIAVYNSPQAIFDALDRGIH